MQHLFLSYDLSVMAKEKGFNEPCFGYFILVDKASPANFKQEYAPTNSVTNCISAPTHQQIIDWFREEHEIWVTADLLPNVNKYSATFVPLAFTPKDFKTVKAYYNDRAKYSKGKFDKYYDALNLAVISAFELI